MSERQEKDVGPHIARQSQQAEIDRMLELLREKIYYCPKSQLQIEKDLGMSRGHLSQLLYGTIEMPFYMLLAILSCAGLDAGAFFVELLPRYPHPVLDQLAQQEARLRRKGKESAADLARLFFEGLVKYYELRASLARVEGWLENLLTSEAGSSPLMPPEHDPPEKL